MGILIRQQQEDWILELREKWMLEIKEFEKIMPFILNNRICFELTYQEENVLLTFDDVKLRFQGEDLEKAKNMVSDLIDLKSKFGNVYQRERAKLGIYNMEE